MPNTSMDTLVIYFPRKSSVATELFRQNPKEEIPDLNSLKELYKYLKSPKAMKVKEIIIIDFTNPIFSERRYPRKTTNLKITKGIYNFLKYINQTSQNFPKIKYVFLSSVGVLDRYFNLPGSSQKQLRYNLDKKQTEEFLRTQTFINYIIIRLPLCPVKKENLLIKNIGKSSKELFNLDLGIPVLAINKIKLFFEAIKNPDKSAEALLSVEFITIEDTSNPEKTKEFLLRN